MEILVSVVTVGPAVDNIQAGEVITVKPDGWGWSQTELSHPNAQIISAPILPTHANMLMMQHTRRSLRVGGITYPRKAYLIDMSTLPNSELFSGARTQSMVTLQ